MSVSERFNCRVERYLASFFGLYCVLEDMILTLSILNDGKPF